MYQDDWRRRMRIITIGFICFLVVGGIAIGIVSAVIKNNDGPGTSPDQPTEIVEPSGEDPGGSSPSEKTVELSKTVIDINVGESVELLVFVRPANVDDEIMWTSADEPIATVDSEGKVTGVAAGTTEITVVVNQLYTAKCTVNVNGEPSSQGGGGNNGNNGNNGGNNGGENGGGNGNNGGGEEVILPEHVYLSEEERTINVGETFTVTAKVIPTNATNKTVTWRSDDAGIATVTSDGKVTGKKPGKATIIATTHNGKTGYLKVTVKQQPQTSIPVSSIKINQGSAKIKVGAQVKLSVTISPANATNKTVTWSSANSNIATVNGSGIVTGKKAGTVTITARTTNGKAASINVVVENVVVNATGVKIEPSTATIFVGATVTLKATITPSNATNKSLTWSSGNISVATVNSNGVVTGKKPGVAKIAVSTHNGKTAIATITVKNAEPTSVSINEKTVFMYVGDSHRLIATVSPAGVANKTVTWSSSNTSVATVSSNGVVVGKKAGTATITAMTYNGKTAAATITVAKKSVGLLRPPFLPSNLSANGAAAKNTLIDSIIETIREYLAPIL